jgi:hypothetical protein
MLSISTTPEKGGTMSVKTASKKPAAAKPAAKPKATDTKALAAVLLKGLPKPTTTREVPRENATLYQWGKGKERKAVVLRRRAIVRLQLDEAPAASALAAIPAERMERGSRPDRQSKEYAFGLQVGPDELAAARELLEAAVSK